MKIFDITINTIAATIGKIAGYQTAAGPVANKTTINGAINYLYSAVGEGLKQNFLGPGVDTEFLMLSIRVYGLVAITTAVYQFKKVADHAYADAFRLPQNTSHPLFN